MPKKPLVQFIQTSEPSFIRQFKERTGIVAGPTLDNKFDDADTGELGDRADERPQVFVDPSSGISESEAQSYMDQIGPAELTDGKTQSESEITTQVLTSDGRIRFRSQNERSKKRQPTQKGDSDSPETNGRERSPIRPKNPPNTSGRTGPLSFGVEEDSEDDEI